MGLSSSEASLSRVITTRNSFCIDNGDVVLRVDRTCSPYSEYDRWQLVFEELKRRGVKSLPARHLPQTAVDSFFFSAFGRLNEQFVQETVLKRPGDYCVWLNYENQHYISVVTKNGYMKHLRIVKTDECFSLLEGIGVYAKTLKDLVFKLYTSPMNVLSVISGSDLQLNRLIGPDFRSSGVGRAFGKIFLPVGVLDQSKLQLLNQTRKHKVYEGTYSGKKVTVLSTIYSTAAEFDALLYELSICVYIKEKTAKSSISDSSDFLNLISAVSVEGPQLSKLFPKTRYGQYTQFVEEHGGSLTDKMECLVQVSWALAELHRLNIIHCNVRTKAVFVDRSPAGRLLFLLGGLDEAKAGFPFKQANPYLSHHLRIIAPEAFSQMVYTKQTDVYAFGVFAWEVFTGLKHLHGESSRNIVINSFFGEPKRFDYNPSNKFSHRVMELVNQCCSGDVSKRPTMNGAWLTLSNIAHKATKNG